MLRLLALAVTLALAAPAAWAQDASDAALRHLRAEHAAYGLTPADVEGMTVRDAYATRRLGVTHVHLQQRHAGLEVFGATANLAVRDGRVVHAAMRFEAEVAARVASLTPALPAPSAAAAAATALDLVPTEPFTVAASKAGGALTLTGGGVADAPIPARLVLQPAPDGTIRLAWDLQIDAADSPDLWSLRIDAATGELLSKGNWTVEEQPRETAVHAEGASYQAQVASAAFREALAPAATGASAGTYRVFELPVESPIHGSRRLVEAPADPTASPRGWHDTGADTYTVTRGNNAHAYEDSRGADIPGYAPSGTGALRFDFPIDAAAGPETNRDAAITNLFYVTNTVHDILYHLGFDEPAGNFQENNFGRGGKGADAVLAEALDGGGTNNANFRAPPDSSRGRMQMFVWSNGYVAEVSAPSGLAGDYTIGQAVFGPTIPVEGLSGRLAVADDGSKSPSYACGPLVNRAEVHGKIVLIDRGGCPPQSADNNFVAKVRKAQSAGAIGVLIVNSEPDPIITLGAPDEDPGADIDIPSGMISRSDGNRLRGATAQVQATLRPRDLPLDGAFDNGIIIHEYVHGLTIRLTGGPSDSDALRNAEQMGEGWSDFFALALTTPPEASGSDARGLATYVLRQRPTDVGLRSAAYSADLAVDTTTYYSVRDARRTSDGTVIPHDVGEVWTAMLWDLYWAYVYRYGYDADLIGGDGGNRRALQLVVDALKLQPANPGFVDARDAILAADELSTGGADGCLIWNVFARRGLGVAAGQGDPDNVDDGLEDFNLPAACLNQSTPVEDPSLPLAFTVHGNYPEPFNPTTTLSFDLPAAADVEVAVYDLLGRRVLSLSPQPFGAGPNRTLRLDASGLASGVYLYHVTARTGGDALVRSGRMTVLK